MSSLFINQKVKLRGSQMKTFIFSQQTLLQYRDKIYSFADLYVHLDLRILANISTP
jgi:hypothetical protein